MMFKFGLALAAGMCVASSLNAAVVDCTYKTNEESFITERYIFAYEAGDPSAAVIDGYIKFKVGKPIEAKLETKADKLVFTWKIEVTDRFKAKAFMRYRNTLDPKAMTAHMTAMAAGVPGEAINFTASGKCDVIDEKTGKAKKSKTKQ
ncbi:MAG: hypothetical protein CFE33_12850 [Pseudorhodobacter sp. PARRP1]|nr:MAG: hypothetical protein CFE33_12850 [Pseudorhodobacter sp. PARRP1]